MLGCLRWTGRAALLLLDGVFSEVSCRSKTDRARRTISGKHRRLPVLLQALSVAKLVVEGQSSAAQTAKVQAYLSVRSGLSPPSIFREGCAACRAKADGGLLKEGGKLLVGKLKSVRTPTAQLR